MSKVRGYCPWLEELCRQAVEGADIREALAITAQGLVSHYPDAKIWFAKKLGKRWSYLAGAGEESFKPVEMIRFTPRYAVFLQNLDMLSEQEKSTLMTCFKQVALKF